MSDYLYRNEPDALFFHTSTHECFTNPSLLEYRVRQREHGARVERDRIRKVLADPATVEAVAEALARHALGSIYRTGLHADFIPDSEVAVAAVTGPDHRRTRRGRDDMSETERTIAELRYIARLNQDATLLNLAADLLAAKQSWIDGAKVDLAGLDEAVTSLGGWVEWLSEVIVDARDACQNAESITPTHSPDWVESGIAMRTTALREVRQILDRERNADPSRFDHLRVERDGLRAEAELWQRRALACGRQFEAECDAADEYRAERDGLRDAAHAADLLTRSVIAGRKHSEATLTVQRDEARAQVDAVLALHQPWLDAAGAATWCSGCDDTCVTASVYPCPTARAIASAGQSPLDSCSHGPGEQCRCPHYESGFDAGFCRCGADWPHNPEATP